MMCIKQNRYEGLSDILHLALCSLVKSPLEATVEISNKPALEKGRTKVLSAVRLPLDGGASDLVWS